MEHGLPRLGLVWVHVKELLLLPFKSLLENELDTVDRLAVDLTTIVELIGDLRDVHIGIFLLDLQSHLVNEFFLALDARAPQVVLAFATAFVLDQTALHVFLSHVSVQLPH